MYSEHSTEVFGPSSINQVTENYILQIMTKQSPNKVIVEATDEIKYQPI